MHGPLFVDMFLLAGIRQGTSPTHASSGVGTFCVCLCAFNQDACQTPSALDIACLVSGDSRFHARHSLHSLSFEAVPLLLQHLQPGMHVLLWACALLLLLLLRLLAPCRLACLPASLLLLLRVPSVRLPSVLLISLPATTTRLLADARPSMLCCSLVCWRLSSRSLRSWPGRSRLLGGPRAWPRGQPAGRARTIEACDSVPTEEWALVAVEGRQKDIEDSRLGQRRAGRDHVAAL